MNGSYNTLAYPHERAIVVIMHVNDNVTITLVGIDRVCRYPSRDVHAWLPSLHKYAVSPT